MKYLIGLIVTIGLIILLIVLLATGGGSKTQVPHTSKALASYSDDASAIVRLTVDGPITAPEKHQATRITVTRDNVTYEQLAGYNGQVTQTQTFGNTQTSFLTFLRAIELGGFTNGDTSTALANDRGHCPLGSRYIFEFEDSNKQLERFWASSCNDVKSFNGNTPLILTLFHRQVPNYDRLTNHSNFSLNL